MNSESLYWLFSSAAQSIAGLIGLLMAGVALAFPMMDRLADEDETLREVIQSLKRRYHRNMAWLASATGIAITTSLLSLYINPWSHCLKFWFMAFAGVMDILVIVGAISFVISVAAPDRYTRAAQREYAEAIKPVATGVTLEPDHVFFREFIELEQDIRDYLKKHDLYVPSRGVPKMSFSFRQMIQALYQHELISPTLRDRLLALNKARNLLFHGHIPQVDEGVVNDLRETRDMWKRERGNQ